MYVCMNIGGASRLRVSLRYNLIALDSIRAPSSSFLLGFSYLILCWLSYFAHPWPTPTASHSAYTYDGWGSSCRQSSVATEYLSCGSVCTCIKNAPLQYEVLKEPWQNLVFGRERAKGRVHLELYNIFCASKRVETPGSVGGI